MHTIIIRLIHFSCTKGKDKKLLSKNVKSDRMGEKREDYMTDEQINKHIK